MYIFFTPPDFCEAKSKSEDEVRACFAAALIWYDLILYYVNKILLYPYPNFFTRRRFFLKMGHFFSVSIAQF